ncbi:MAG: Gfo/Idh/MocA family oxidoreductase [Planctomycetes bacterium]|nr:Gfo/Idh/MocA family oxidoreductase [Planctomycetota bacterium]
MDKHEHHANGGSSRRDFLRAAAGAGAAWTLSGPLAGAGEPQGAAPVPQGEVSRKVRLGLVGCGGRGTWIAGLFRQHGGFELHSAADYFEDSVEKAGDALGVERSRRFTGLSGYRKLIESGVEAVAILDVPFFYPVQARAAVEVGCHVYMAKPVAVDVPGCLAIEAAGRLATEKRRVFFVDYQMRTDPVNIEVARRVREGALGRIVHLESAGFSPAWGDSPRGATIEDLLRQGKWLSTAALSGDNIVSYDIHIIDAVIWLLGRRPACAVGFARRCRPNAIGDRQDASVVAYQLEDGTIWSHRNQALDNGAEWVLRCEAFGETARAQITYWGKSAVLGGPQAHEGEVVNLYDEGAKRNIADFYTSVVGDRFENPTVRRAVDGTLTAILGREAAARGARVTMEEILKEKKALAVDLAGLRA